MNKIVNWTVGSFFRTIGRIIAYIGIGYIITLLISNSDFRLDDLFLVKAHASTWNQQWIPTPVQWRTSGGTYANTNYGSDSYHAFFGSANGISLYDMKFPSQYSIESDTDSLYFNILFRINSVNSYDINLTENQYKCTIADTDWEHIYSGQHDWEYEYTSFTCASHQTNGYIEGQEHKVALTLGYWYNNNEGVVANCMAVANAGDIYTFKCPKVSNNINGLVFKVYTNQATSYVLGTYMLFSKEHDSSQAIIDSVTNQTQQQQQQHQEIMDDNTTQAEDEATSFFEDFDVPDVGGLSAIITAPLNTIRSLLNSTCTPLVLPLPFVNENLTLPCLTTIYTEHFGAFFTLYQTIILAIVAYRCIRSIFFDIHGFTDPSDDRIEVMDL